MPHTPLRDFFQEVPKNLKKFPHAREFREAEIPLRGGTFVIFKTFSKSL